MLPAPHSLSARSREGLRAGAAHTRRHPSDRPARTTRCAAACRPHRRGGPGRHTAKASPAPGQGAPRPAGTPRALAALGQPHQLAARRIHHLPRGQTASRPSPPRSRCALAAATSDSGRARPATPRAANTSTCVTRSRRNCRQAPAQSRVRQWQGHRSAHHPRPSQHRTARRRVQHIHLLHRCAASACRARCEQPSTMAGSRYVQTLKTGRSDGARPSGAYSRPALAVRSMGRLRGGEKGRRWRAELSCCQG